MECQENKEHLIVGVLGLLSPRPKTKLFNLHEHGALLIIPSFKQIYRIERQKTIKSMKL